MSHAEILYLALLYYLRFYATLHFETPKRNQLYSIVAQLSRQRTKDFVVIF